MTPGPVQPAELVHGPDGRPRVPAHADRDDPVRAGRLLAASELPRRWQGRDRFVVLDTGFGAGGAFLRTWAAWRADPGRCARLVVLAIEPRPLDGDDLRRRWAEAGDLRDEADALVGAWPPLTPDLHRLAFDAARVQLLLAFGEVAAWLPEWIAEVDAFYLHGMADERADPVRRGKALARLAAPGAILATTAPPDASWGEALRSAGFTVEPGPGDSTRARFAPRFAPRRAPRTRPAPGRSRHAVVVGAGLAGCATALALAEQGWHSTVIDRQPEIAAEASGNPAGLFHGIVHAQDGAHARFGRIAALAAAEAVETALAHGVDGAIDGLLRLEQGLDVVAMRARLARLGLPAAHVQALDAADASARAGVPLAWPCWFYPRGGWVAPAALAADFLRRAGSAVTLRTGLEVAALAPGPEGWRLLDAGGAVLAESATVVLANGCEALRLLGAPDWPVRAIRGQLSIAPAPAFALPRVPIAGSGYALADARGRLVFGATARPDDVDPAVRIADHDHNLAQLARLLGRPIDLAAAELGGRTGWRCSAVDRLPLIGAVPDLRAPPARRDQPRFVPRREGLFMLAGLGSRGISWSLLGARVLAAWTSGAPVPLPAALLDAVDPARFALLRGPGRAR